MLATVAEALTTPEVGLRPPAAGVVTAKMSAMLAHACAWFAAASLDTKGMPHARPADNRSRKAIRRCLELLCRFSDANLDIVYAHSVHVKSCKLCAYTYKM